MGRMDYNGDDSPASDRSGSGRRSHNSNTYWLHDRVFCNISKRGFRKWMTVLPFQNASQNATITDETEISSVHELKKINSNFVKRIGDFKIGLYTSVWHTWCSCAAVSYFNSNNNSVWVWVWVWATPRSAQYISLDFCDVENGAKTSFHMVIDIGGHCVQCMRPKLSFPFLFIIHL